jgi:hypothetical protein
LLAPTGIIKRVEETHVSLHRKLCMLEAVASTALFPCANGVNFRMIYFLEGSFFKVEIGSLCSKYAYTLT